MSNARLEVEIGASIKEFQRKLADALKGLKALKDENKNLEKSFKDGKITADSAVNTMSEFYKVIQAFPYGIRGVADKIRQLTKNFGYLKNQTGSTSSALKAMLGTLTGPAGILLAVSAVTSIMVSHGDVIMNLIKGNNALASSQKAVTSALNDFYGGQVTKIQSYVSILGQANTSETQRKQLTEELIRLVPSLKKEDFNYGSNLDIVRKKIGQYVLAQASRVEADTLVQENSEKLSQKARITRIKEIKDEKKKIEEITKFLKDSGKDLMQTRSTTSTMGMIGFETVQKTKTQIIDTFKKFENELTKDLKPIEDRISQLYSDAFNGGLGGSKKTQKNVFVEERQVKFKEEILETVNIGQSDSEKEWNTINWDEYYKLKEFDNQRNLLAEKMLNLSQTADTLINQSISSSFNSLANNISNSLGQSAGFFGAFAGEIIKLGSRMLIAQLAQDKAKKASNLAVAKTNAIVTATETAKKTKFGAFLLPALITTGLAAVSSAFGKTGTNAGNVDLDNNGRNFSSGFSGGYSSNQPQRIELYARGEELYGVLDNFLRRNGNQGGNLSLS